MLMDAAALDREAITSYHRGALPQSVQWLTLAIEEAQKEGDLEVELMSRGHLSEAYTKMGEFARAVDAATLLLRKARSAEDPRHAMRAMSLLAIGIERVNLRGRWEQFRSLVLEALSMARALPSDGYWVVQNLETLGLGHLRMRQLEAAFRSTQSALNALRPETFESEFFRARAFQNLADVTRLNGRPAEAKHFAQAAFEAADEYSEHAPQLRCGAQVCLARICRSEGDFAEALDLADQVLDSAIRHRWRYEEQLCEQLRGEIYLERRQGAEALAACERALALAEALGMIEEQVVSRLNVGSAQQLLGDPEVAYASFRAAWLAARERGYPDHQQAAERAARNLGKRITEEAT